MSLTAKIVPLERLLLIENNCPLLPSNESELSANTLKVIGEFACPTKLSEGTVVPVPPNVPLVKKRLPTIVVVPPMVAELFTVRVLLNVTGPVTPSPPVTSNVLPIPTVEVKYEAPLTFNVDLKVVAPVTPKPPVIFADPATPSVEAKLTAPVTPNPPVILVEPATPRVDAKLTAPVTPKPPVILVEPATPSVDVKLTAPVIPNPAYPAINP